MKGKKQMKNTISKAVFAGAVALAAVSASSADDYRFIVGGYPAENKSHSEVSDAAPLVAGVLATASASAPMEARRFVSGDSAGCALRSDKFTALYIIVR